MAGHHSRYRSFFAIEEQPFRRPVVQVGGHPHVIACARLESLSVLQTVLPML
jgi:hypothetical protein